MFYRPHFCCHCGEKIIRARWTPLTSRRFCEFCAIEQKQHDLIPRAAAITVVLFGAAGLTAYFAGGNGGSSKDAGDTAKIRQLTNVAIEKKVNAGPEDPVRLKTVAAEPSNVNSVQPATSPANPKQRVDQRNLSTESVYYCGAMTKKGTACTRRVKTPGRCWQHRGQPAMSSLPN